MNWCTSDRVIARLPKSVSVYVKAQLLAIVAGPRWAYGLASTIHPFSTLQALDVVFKRGCGPGETDAFVESSRGPCLYPWQTLSLRDFRVEPLEGATSGLEERGC